MKKSKAVYSFLSIILCACLMFGIFSSASFKQPKQTDIKIYGVKGNFQKLSDNILQNTKLRHEKIQNIDENKNVYLGGFPIGLKLYADGVVIVGTETVDTENGEIDIAQNAGLKVGDIIKKINDIEVKDNKSVSDIISASGGNPIKLQILRNNEIFETEYKTALSISENKYKAGIWIRDSSAGIGTVTFCLENGFFASLGHAVCDIDTKKTIPISRGESTSVNITGFQKGTTGKAGEISGYLESDSTGKVFYNGRIGVYGCFNSLPNTKILPLGKAEEIILGPATIFTTLENGIVEEYAIDIVSLDYDTRDNKNLVIKVTDSRLLEKTGGIIQGMSGSPIVQNGKLIGAVTHVFLNDPSGGFGIFAETMLKNTEYIAKINGE